MQITGVLLYNCLELHLEEWGNRCKEKENRVKKACKQSPRVIGLKSFENVSNIFALHLFCSCCIIWKFTIPLLGGCIKTLAACVFSSFSVKLFEFKVLFHDSYTKIFKALTKSFTNALENIYTEIKEVLMDRQSGIALSLWIRRVPVRILLIGSSGFCNSTLLQKFRWTWGQIKRVQSLMNIV